MIIETCGEMLFYPECDCVLREFPSPEELKYRIIISTKPPKEYLKAASKNTRNNSAKDSDEDEWGKEPQDLTADQEDDGKVLGNKNAFHPGL